MFSLSLIMWISLIQLEFWNISSNYCLRRDKVARGRRTSPKEGRKTSRMTSGTVQPLFCPWSCRQLLRCAFSDWPQKWTATPWPIFRRLGAFVRVSDVHDLCRTSCPGRKENAGNGNTSAVTVCPSRFSFDGETLLWEYLSTRRPSGSRQ